MSQNHVMSRIGHDDVYQIKCTCGWRSPLVSVAECELQEYQHNHEVSRMRSALQRGKQLTESSLTAERKWYIEQSEDPSNSPEERALWKQLADELGNRFRVHSVEQPTLW